MFSLRMVKIPSSNCPRVQMIRPVLSGKNWKLKQNIWKIPWELMVIFCELFQIIWVQFTWHVLIIWSKPKKKDQPRAFLHDHIHFYHQIWETNWVLQGHNISLQSDKTFSSLKSKKVWKWCMPIPQREN